MFKIYRIFLSKIKNVIKKYLRKKLQYPTNVYQNVHTNIKIKDYHTGKFNFYNNKFCLNDLHLFRDTETTRLRKYFCSKYAELAVKDNKIGSFLSIGISYGTTCKIITHLLDKQVKKIEYFLIDNYCENLRGERYNTNIKNVTKDLNKIKNFKFNFIIDLLNESSLRKVSNNLIFTHMNIGNFNVEFKYFVID